MADMSKYAIPFIMVCSLPPPIGLKSKPHTASQVDAMRATDIEQIKYNHLNLFNVNTKITLQK